MRLTLQTDYALRVLMYLAAAPHARATVEEVAQAYGVSRNHMMKVVQRLAQAGLILSRRGRTGGFALAAAPAEINIGAVVRAFEDCGHFVECFDVAGNGCPAIGHCGLAGALGGAVRAFLAHLDGFTLADIVADGPGFRATLRAA